MNVDNIVSLVKKVHPESLIMIKIGKFYNAYGKDSVIMSNLFGYRIKNDVYRSSGFPTTSLNKVMIRLEKEKINYIVLDRRDNYEVLNEEDFKKENRYEEVYAQSLLELKVKKEIRKLNKYIMDNINNEATFRKLKRLEKELLYEE